jgi:FkbM family methyltransferase
MIFYSQYKQDEFLYENYFINKNQGYYIDIGAHNGVDYSNTLFFEKLGWDGVCFEPIPSVFEQLKKNRTCKVLNCALSDKEGKSEFLVLEGYTEMLSGLVENYNENHKSRIDLEISLMGGKKTIIECKTDLFDNFNFPKEIDYISLDVEGSELTILKTIDFDKYKIKFMTVEANHHQEEIKNFMFEKKFELITSLGCDLVFKNNTI